MKKLSKFLKPCMVLVIMAMLSVTVFAKTLTKDSILPLEDIEGRDRCTYKLSCTVNTVSGTTATGSTKQYIGRIRCVPGIITNGYTPHYHNGLGANCYMYMDYQDMLGHVNSVKIEIGYAYLGDVDASDNSVSYVTGKSGIAPPPSSSWYSIIEYPVYAELHYDVVDGKVDSYNYDNLWITEIMSFSGTELN